MCTMGEQLLLLCVCSLLKGAATYMCVITLAGFDRRLGMCTMGEAAATAMCVFTPVRCCHIYVCDHTIRL